MDILPMLTWTTQHLPDRVAQSIRETVPDPRVLSDWQVSQIAQAVAATVEEAARLDRPRQRRREWMLLIVGLIAGALLSIPVGIWVNSIT
ncbi:hypothetical protein ACQEVF_59065 [Nonomuraea polychroma]|uniref:hypothetical protein n=1 Tax=Nonomuraea polychroma TaxID=46176 RepID=UPI003D89F450